MSTFSEVLWVTGAIGGVLLSRLLQQWLERWTGNAALAAHHGIGDARSAHLGFYRIFPNWRWAIMPRHSRLCSLGLAWHQRAQRTGVLVVTHAMRFLAGY